MFLRLRRLKSQIAAAFPLVISVAAGSGSALGSDPALRFGFECPGCPSGPVTGFPRSSPVIEVVATLIPEGPGEVRGWTLSVAGEGGQVNWASVEALGNLPPTAAAVEGAFSKTEFTFVAEPGSPCEGRSGVVSRVVLPPPGPVAALEPGGPLALLNITFRQRVPDTGECASGRLFHADGCQDSEGPALNRVSWDGREVAPALDGLTLEVCPPETCAQAPVNTMIQSQAIPESARPFEGLLTSSIDERAKIEVQTPIGQKAEVSFYAAIVSQGLVPGVQGWSFSIRVRGMKALGGGLRGTAAERAYDGGFVMFQIVDPSRPGGCGRGQGEGFVSAAVLSHTELVTLLPTGTAPVLALTVGSKDPQGSEPIEGQVDWIDGLAGAG